MKTKTEYKHFVLVEVVTQFPTQTVADDIKVSLGPWCLSSSVIVENIPYVEMDNK